MLPLKLLKTQKVSFQGRQSETKYFLLSTKHFCKYAANAPEIHGGGVAGLKQDFWSSVPQRDDLQRQTVLSVTEEGGYLLKLLILVV